jgi:hypothetical protein
MDWIEARLKCSPDHAWITLCEVVRSDVDRFRSLTNSESPTVEQENGRVLIVSNGKRFVTLQSIDNKIAIRQGHQHGDPKGVEKFSLIPTLNQNGECRLRFNRAELEFWQASREILENLLFD